MSAQPVEHPKFVCRRVGHAIDTTKMRATIACTMIVQCPRCRDYVEIEVKAKR